MDSILFAMKRSHQASLRFGHKVLAPFGLTPARFDMMFALTRIWSREQRELTQALGVARSTASRMLGSLERLGLVERSKRRHTRRVYLTEAGAALLRRAVKRVYRGRLAFRRVARALRVGRRSHTREFMARDALEGTLDRFRQEFGDRATLYYAWYEDH